MSNYWIDKDDCKIVRPDSAYDIKVPGSAVLMDATEGTRLFVVPESWTDEQIWRCLEIANMAFTEGDGQGSRRKVWEIKTALNIHD